MAEERQSLEDEMAEFDDMDGDSDFDLGDDTNEEGADDADTDEADDEGGEEDQEEESEEGDSDDEDSEEGEGEEEEDEEDGEGDELADDDVDDEEETAEETIIRLRQELAKQASLPTQQQQVVTETEEATDDEEQELPDFVFATEENMDDIVSDPDAFNKAVNAGVKQAMEHYNKVTQQNAIQAVQLSLPQIVNSQVVEQQNIQKAVTTFYSDHSDLADFKPIVAQNIQALQAASPEKTLSDLMDEAAEMTYKQLALNVKAKKGSEKSASKKKPKNTGLRKGKKSSKARSTRFNKANIPALQQELDEMD